MRKTFNGLTDHSPRSKARDARRRIRVRSSHSVIAVLAFASCLLQLPLAIAAQPDAAPAVIGVVAPQGQIGAHADLGGSLCQQLLTSLAGAHTQALALDSQDPQAAAAEAKARGCS